MAKQFMYFQTTDGGMVNFPVTGPRDLRDLLGWMNDSCMREDQKLLRWMESAQVGEMTEHRLGCLVRLKDDGTGN